MRRTRADTSGEVTALGVSLVDAPESRVHQNRDLFGLALSALGIALVLVLSVYAHNTTSGVTQDVQTITRLLNSILNAAVVVLMNLATIAMPLIVVTDLLIRRQPRLAADGVGAALVTYGAVWAAVAGLEPLSNTAMVRGLSVTQDGTSTITISLLAVAVAALLTTVGPRSRRPVLALSWNLLWAALATDVLTGRATLPAAVVTVLIGRLFGLAMRYFSGVTTDRATGAALVEGIRKAGIDPVRIVRVRDISDPESPTIRLDVTALREMLGQAAKLDPNDPGASLTPQQLQALSLDPVSDPTALALERLAGNRVYAVYDQAGDRWDAIVLDGDRQVVGMLQQTWRALRLRGMDRRAVTSLRQGAERAALLSYAAAAAGVRTPQMVGVAEADDSMILLQEHPSDLRSLRDMRASEVSDDCIKTAWRQLRLAHEAGLAHRAITSDSILFGVGSRGEQPVWLIGWDRGDVASSELARRLDVTQMLAVFGLSVGAERAVATAAAELDAEFLASVAPLLQSVALPSQTRAEAKGRGDVLDAVRQALLDLIPQAADSEPFRLVRFGWRTIVIFTISIVALWIVVTRLNFDGIVKAVNDANPWWMAVAFALALSTYVGSALGMIGFSPVKLSFRDTVLTQVASSFVALAAPAGMGPAALNLRLLTKKRVTTSLAVASVALVQLTLFAITVILLVVISLVTGDTRVLAQVPVTAVLVLVAVVAVLGLLLLLPAVRKWLWLKIGPTFAQAWPRLVWVLGQPKKLTIGLGGNLLQAVGYVGAFWASLMAFGIHSIAPMNIALIYFLGNAAGSAVPTPGGLGTVELAMSGGLASAGLAAPLALSTAVLFRALTYWARVPLGWIAWRYLQARDVL